MKFKTLALKSKYPLMLVEIRGWYNPFLDTRYSWYFLIPNYLRFLGMEIRLITFDNTF